MFKHLAVLIVLLYVFNMLLLSFLDDTFSSGLLAGIFGMVLAKMYWKYVNERT